MSQEEQESRKLILSEDDEDDYLPNDQNEKDLDDHDSFSQSSSTRVGFRKSTDPNDTIIDWLKLDDSGEKEPKQATKKTISKRQKKMIFYFFFKLFF